MKKIAMRFEGEISLCAVVSCSYYSHNLVMSSFRIGVKLAHAKSLSRKENGYVSLAA